MILGLLLVGCGGGGGGSADPISPAQWPQFRNDNARTGAFGGILLGNPGALRFAVVDDGDNPSPVSASPAIGVDGTIYVASEGGTLKALAGDDLSPRWTVRDCDACCPPSAPQPCDPRLGGFVSSPTIFRDIDLVTNLIVADLGGRLYRYTFDEDDPNSVPMCEACFAPDLSADFPTGAVASFRSSPAITFNTVTGSLASMILGAEIRAAAGAEPSAGKLYAINADGTVRWQYPARGRGSVGPISSSPSLGLGASVIVADGDDIVHFLTREGALKRTISVPELTTDDAFLQPSVVSSASFLVGSSAGEVYAFNQDGSFRWSIRLPGESFLNSLAVGFQAAPFPTIEPTVDPSATATPTPDPNEPTPTPTPTPTFVTEFSTVFGVTADGDVLFIDSANGEIMEPAGVSAGLEAGAAVVSSPALGLDGLLTFASTDGSVFVFDSGTGEQPRTCVVNPDIFCSSDGDCPEGDMCDATAWPIRIVARCEGGPTVGQPCRDDAECGGFACRRASVRSSPVIDTAGAIYVGADDGYLYVVGATGTPARTSTPTPSPTPSAVP